jgi:hypothetical protein
MVQAERGRRWGRVWTGEGAGEESVRVGRGCRWGEGAGGEERVVGANRGARYIWREAAA